MIKSKKLQDPAALPKATPAPQLRAQGGVGTSDVLVLLAMAAASVALGFGLYLQANFAMISAGLAAAAAFAAAAIMHAQLMRIRTLEQVVDGVSAGDAAEATPAAKVTPTLAPAARNERLPTRREPTLPRSQEHFEPEDLDRATDNHAGQLSLVAAALRDAEPAAARRVAPTLAARAAAPVTPLADVSSGWAEPGAVDALVRQYAEELDRGTIGLEPRREPEPVMPIIKANPPTPRLPSPPLVPQAALESALSQAIRKAAEGEIEIHLQPVVAFSDRKARLYEVFPKLVDAKGKVHGQADYLPAATAMGLALAIERAAILRCCSIQRKLSEKGRARAMIVRLTAAAVRDRAFLQRLLSDMQADPLLADLMIFEVDQAVIEQGDGAERENMELLARAGFRFALGSADTLGLEVEELAARRIGFVRIAAALLAAEGNPAAVEDLRQGAVETILTGVATEDHARLGQEFGLVLGQGSLFSEAKPLRADVVNASGQSRVA